MTSPSERLRTELLFWAGLFSMFVVGTAAAPLASVVGARALGLDATVVMTGSMSPSIRAGDVVVSRPVDGPVDTGRVVRFRGPGGQFILHRVIETRPDGLVTAGDANPTPDGGVRRPGDVTGAAVAIIPMAGLPLLWWHDGNYSALMLLVAVVIGALVLVASGALGRDPWADLSRSVFGPLTERRVARTVLVDSMFSVTVSADSLRSGP